jgi:hypothetical protein
MSFLRFRRLAVAAWAVAAPAVHACSCATPGNPAQELQANMTSSVFRGTVLEVIPHGTQTDPTVVFRTERVWKGRVEALKSVATLNNLCGYPFVAGQEYVVYAGPGDVVSLCSRTRRAIEATEDLLVLGPGQVPQPASLAARARHAALAGAWYHPQRAGEGFLVDVLEDGRGVVHWFGFQPVDGQRQSWLSGIGTFDGTTLHVPKLTQPVGGGFGPGFDATAVQNVPWGELTLRLGYDGIGAATWRSDLPAYGSGSFALQRLTAPPRPAAP